MDCGRMKQFSVRECLSSGLEIARLEGSSYWFENEKEQPTWAAPSLENMAAYTDSVKSLHLILRIYCVQHGTRIGFYALQGG